MNSAKIINQTSGQLVPSGKWGGIYDVNVCAGSTATYVALYSGTSAVAANMLSIHKVAANSSVYEHECKIQFDDTGVYAVVDANTYALIIWGEWGGAKATPVLSGG